ncbi:trypsin-like serine peptidase [Marinactinospora thermotolerans]|uniref:V8-like Glu-specific endopeptidase n=2 Tax=Marinactinospora thermotolerans TaxID=531310 RepID=A0A1T4TCE4_9ACTN|nr:serine protease [Marinactinospora thermotolerans]ART67220.1 serine protease [Marinactinospora thermotolerans]SKA38164.1 V8-like Glu-specific endopeptidase [Marinactinospora thermotolerans DSM 45154]
MTSTLASKVLGPLAGAVLITTGVTTGAPASAADAVPPAEGVVHQTAAAEPSGRRTTLAYWTPERMADAVPLGEVLSGALGGATPGRHPAAAAAQSTGTPWEGGGLVTSTTGKVFLTLDGSDFTCSASVVRADNRDTVVTAGHCLKDGTGSWARNWVFVPAYDDGAEPHGRFPARELLVPPEWARQADDSYDFGMAVLGPNSEGAHVADETGTQRIAFGTGNSAEVHAFGYPSERPYDGSRLHYCAGPTRPDRQGTTAAGMACRMTEGSSGGPWLSDFDSSTGTGTITSVISFKYSDDAGTQYGPRLDDAAERLYHKAQSL